MERRILHICLTFRAGKEVRDNLHQPDFLVSSMKSIDFPPPRQIGQCFPKHELILSLKRLQFSVNSSSYSRLGMAPEMFPMKDKSMT